MVLGCVRCTYDWNRIAAENDMRRAIDTGPNSAWAHWSHSWHLMLFERQDDTIAEMCRARDLDPFIVLPCAESTRTGRRVGPIEVSDSHVDRTFLIGVFLLSAGQKFLRAVQ